MSWRRRLWGSRLCRWLSIILIRPRHPLLLPEIVGNVLANVRMRDLARCARVNRTWSTIALKRMYQGFLWDMQFRTPDIVSLNCLFVASRERFSRHMGNVKHLLIAAEVTVDNSKLLPMRDKEYAKSLFRAHNPRVKSLLIPFGIHARVKHEFMDVFLTPSIEYLAIDDEFCTEIVENIRALTIYRSGSNRSIQDICALIRRCNLEFFHIEDDRDPLPMSEEDATRLIECLKEQTNLKALVLVIPDLLSKFGEVLAHEIPWPGLKGLFIGNYGDRFCLRAESRTAKLDYGCCTLVTDTYRIPGILPAFQRLEKLTLGETTGEDPPSESYEQFFRRFPYLPSLKVISVYWKARLDLSCFQKVAVNCPQLTILNLEASKLGAFLDSLGDMPPFPQLQILKISEMDFTNPREWLRGIKLEELAVQWGRVFPKLRKCPAPTDRGYPLSDEQMQEALLADPNGPGHYPLDTDYLLTRVSTVLGYEDWISNDVEYVSQSQLETEILGWPIVASWVYDPWNYHGHSTYL
ncbi:hypothetical protein BDW74DRAFT_185602 [Aspergillus multicolor]|uniref:uncharacterized protein n=1 Tax=Aspergillus multicolor TaxID=41759 RepID=UPI003CCDAFD2